MDPIQYKIFKIILSLLSKTMKHLLIILQLEYVNKIENRITFRIKIGYYIQLLISEIIKLFPSTKNQITKVKNVENAPHLEVPEVALVQCNIVNNDYQQDSRVLDLFVHGKSFGQLLESSPKTFRFLKILNLELL